MGDDTDRNTTASQRLNQFAGNALFKDVVTQARSYPSVPFCVELLAIGSSDKAIPDHLLGQLPAQTDAWQGGLKSVQEPKSLPRLDETIQARRLCTPREKRMNREFSESHIRPERTELTGPQWDQSRYRVGTVDLDRAELRSHARPA